MKDSFKPIIRVIASIIIAAFLAQDIVWAYPSEGNRNLAVTGLKHDETLNSLKTVMVEKQIDSLGGNTIGKLFLDRKGKRQVKNGIIAVEKEGELSFFYQKGNKYAKLYTKDGHRAAVKVVEGLIIALESGRRIRVKVIEGNDEIRGWGNKSQGGTIYLKRSLLNEEIALYHERREAHYAKHPEELPKGVNAHTFLRGCGKDIRRIVYDEVSTGVLGPKFNAEEVINFLKKALKKDRWNDAEFNLIRDNEAKRLFGLQLLYGEQDNQFTPASNDDFTGRLTSGSRQERPSRMADLLHSFTGLFTSRTHAQRLKDTVTNDGYRHIELEGRGYYMALLISHADIPPNIKPAAGGVVFTQVDKKVFEEGIDKEALIQKAKAAAKEIDLASALWNTYLRGGAMAIISDGTRSKKDILKEVAVTLAHNHVLGWQFIAIADLGTFEKDINIIRDAVYEETLKTYLRDTPLYGDDHERRRIERILNTRQWDSLDARFIWEEGIAMPVWGRGEDRPWELAGTAFIGALETLLNANKEGHVIADIDNNFPNILVYGAGGRVGRAITGAIIRELSGRACLHGVSDEGGAVYQSVELDPYSVMDYIERKNSGEVVTFAPLDRNYNSDKDKVYRYSKDQLFQFLGKETDILVLAERGRTLTDDEVRGMQAKVVIEALPGILTESQIEILRGQGKRYIPPHCIYGATFYGVRESLMHRIIPKESRHIGDLYAHIQSGVREYSVAAMYEVLDRIDLESKADISRPGIRTVTKELCEQILNEEHLLWEELRKIASDKLNKTLEELTGIRDGREMADSIAPFADSQEMKDVLELTRINYYPKGRVSAIALMTAVAEVARNKIIYGEGSRVRAMRYLAGEDLMKKELAAFHMARLQDADAIDLLLKNLKEEFIEKGFASYRVRANCAKALGFIYQKAGSDDKKKIFEGLVSALGDSSAEAASWARWAIITNDIGITTAIQALESEIPEKEDQIRVTAEQGYDTQSPRLVLAELYFKTGNLYALRGNKTHALKSYKEAQEIAQHFLQTYNFMLPLRVQILLARINEEIEADKESAINSYLRLVSRRQFIDIGKFTNDALPKSIQHYYRQFALQAILGIYRPYGTNVNIRTASEINDIIESLNEGVFSGSVSGTNDIRGAIEYIENTCGGDLAGYNIPYLGLLILYATDLLTLYGKDVEPLNAVVEDILVKRLLTDKEGEALSSDAIEDNLKGLESYRNLSMKQQELLKYIFTDLYISGEHKDGIKKSASYAGGTKAGVPALFDSEKQEELGATIWSAMNSKGGEYIHIIVKPEEETGKVGIRVLRFKDGKKISKGAEEKKVVETFINSIKKFSLLNERLSDGQKILIPPGMGELYVVISLPPEAPNAIYDGFRDVLELLPDGSLRVDDEAIQHAFLADKDPLKRMLIIPRKLIDNEAALISAMARIGFAGDLTGSVRAVRILEQLKKYLYRHGSSSPEAYEATEAVIDRQIEILKAELGETLSAELLDNDRHDDAVPPAGIESRLLRPLIDYNMRAGRFGRLIAALGGLEEVFYSGVFIGGLSCIMHSPAIAVSIFAAAAALHFSRMIAALWYARILKNTKTHYWYAQNAARRLGRLNILKGISTKALRRASENNKFKDVRKTSIDELNKYGGRENIISGLIHGFNKFTLSALFAAVLGLAIDGLSAPGLYNSALAGLGVASAVYFRMRHSKEVFRLTGGVFKSGPPTKKDLNILTLAGIIFRSIYISLLIFLPYGNLNIFTALPAAILSHSLYNILTPWVLGTVQERPDVKRSNFAWQNFVLDREKSVNGTTSLKIDYWHGPLRELKNAGGKERCEFEIAGVHGRWVPLIDEYDQIVVAHIRAKDDQTVLDDYFVFRLDPASENLLVDNELKELGLEGERLLYYAARGARPVPARIPLKASLKEELNPNMLIGFIKAAVGGARLLECYGRQLARTPKRWSTWALEPELEDPETLKAIAEPFLAPGHEESDALPLSFTRHKRAARLPDLVTFDSEGKFGLIAEFGFHGVTELYKKNVNGLWFMLKQGMHNKGPSLPGRAAFYTDDIATRGIKGNIGVISEFQNDILKKAASSLCERSDLIEKDVLSFLMRLQTIFDLMVDSYGKRGGEAPLPGTVYYMVGGALKLNTLGRIKLPVIAKFVLNKEDGKYVLSDNGIRILDQFDNLEDLLASSYSKLKEIEERQSEVMAPMMGNASAVPVSSPEVGGAMGKLFRDKGAKELIRKGIVAKEELGHVVFYDQHDNILYTKDGMEARVKLTGDILSPVSGLEIILIEENEHIRGFAERGKVYMSKVLLFRDIAIFHELRESYYSLHPRELPPKINAHTFLRGCGKKTRAMVSEAFNSGGLNPDFSFGELIYYLRIHLPIGGVNHAEMRLIEYNGRQGSTGIELVYGEQDRVFGALMNGNFTKELSLGPRYKTSQQEPVAMDAGDAAGVIANEPKTDPADPEKNSGGEEKLEAQPPELAAAAISFGQIMIRAMPSTQDAAPEAIKGRAVVLYADDILERAAAGDLAYTIRSTQVLDDSTIVIYGKNPVMAQILDGIIRKAAGDKKIDLVKIEAEELSGYNCYDEIKVAYPDEAKELEVVLRKFSSIPGIKNRNVFGVIKGMTNESSLEGIRKFASEVDLPVVSFEDDKGMYSFRNALSTLIAITKDSTPPANREWYRTLKPIEREDMERAYQDYRRALELAINA